MSGASVAPMIEPVAKITAELAPVNACAAASRRTLDRARASSEISLAAVTSIICGFRPDAAHYGQAPLIPDTMTAGVRSINRCKRAHAMRTMHIAQSTRRGVNQKPALYAVSRHAR